MNNIEKVIADLKIQAGITLPLESVIVAAINYATTNRATMSQPNIDRWDDLALDLAEPIGRGLVALFEKLNVPPETP
ncbi:MAG TPA: hypothetical protein VFI02_19300 [Armatimonadota bacterium]|nr:hypothetical protein [Armatimonadota bacterium]